MHANFFKSALESEKLRCASYHIVLSLPYILVCCFIAVYIHRLSPLSRVIYLHLLLLSVEHFRINAQWAEHTHHQLFLSQPGTELIGC